jgi:hypothetical protein
MLYHLIYIIATDMTRPPRQFQKRNYRRGHKLSESCLEHSSELECRRTTIATLPCSELYSPVLQATMLLGEPLLLLAKLPRTHATQPLQLFQLRAAERRVVRHLFRRATHTRLFGAVVAPAKRGFRQAIPVMNPSYFSVNATNFETIQPASWFAKECHR